MATELLTERTQVLRKQLEEHRELATVPLEDPCTVYIGDGYFVTMALAEARAFLHKKIKALEDELSSLSQFTGLNEDGEPVFDIVEELDEDGEVIQAKVSQAGLSNYRADIIPNQVAPTPTSQPEEKLGTTVTDEKPSTSQPESEKQQATDQQGSSDDNDEVQYIEDISQMPPIERPGEDTSNGEYRDIDPSEFLELMIEEDDEDDDYAGSDLDIEDDEEFTEFNFDDIEEEDDDDDDDDDDNDDDDDEGDEDSRYRNFGWKGGSLFPGDAKTREMIKAHLAGQAGTNKHDHSHSHETSEIKETPAPAEQKQPEEPRVPSPVRPILRKANAEKKVPAEGAKKGGVQFAQSVDVREFETDPTERKYVPNFSPPAVKLSRFRISRNSVQQQQQQQQQQRKPADHPPVTKPSPSSPTKKPINAAAAAAAAVTRSPPGSHQVHGAVVERDARSPVSSPAKRSAATRVNTKTTPMLRKSTVLHLPRVSPKDQHPKDQNRKDQHNPMGPSTEQTRESTQEPQHEHVRKEAKPKDAPSKGELPKSSAASKDASSKEKSKDEPAKPGTKQPPVQLEKEDPEIIEKPEKDDHSTLSPSDAASLKARVDADAARIFEESFVSDEEFLKLHDPEHANHEDVPSSDQPNARIQEVDEAAAKKIEQKNKLATPSKQDYQSKPIMTSVVERDVSEDDEEEVEDEGSDANNEVDMTEIKQAYQKLRQKLIYSSGGYLKKDSEKEIEPISEDGAPKKVSRFKAARIV